MGYRKSAKRWVSFTAGLVGALCLVGTADAQLFVSEKEIERQARLQWLQMKHQLATTSNPRLQAYVECIAYSVIDVLEPSWGDLAWEVVVFEEDSINAFAMPGGKVGVFTGILRVADTPDALAAVLGHEIAHLTSDHVMERAKRQSRGELLSILGGAATGMGDVFRTGTAVLWTLPFSRKQESEADVVGLDYMAKAGYDPRATLDLWKKMSAERASPAEFMSTHPSDDRRLDDLVKKLAPALIEYNTAREAGVRSNCGG